MAANRRKRPPDSTGNRSTAQQRSNNNRPTKAKAYAATSGQACANGYGSGAPRKGGSSRARTRSKSGTAGTNPGAKGSTGKSRKSSISLADRERGAIRADEDMAMITGEGILCHLDSHLGYIWSCKHSSIYFHQRDLDTRLKSSEKSQELSEIFNLGDRVMYHAERQQVRNGCAYKATWVSFLECWRGDASSDKALAKLLRGRYSPGRADSLCCDTPPLVPHVLPPIGTPPPGRRYSLPASPPENGDDPGGQATEVTIGLGVITNAFKEGYGFVWSEMLGRVYFTRDSYVKQFPQATCLFGDGSPELKQSVCFEAVPQKGFSPSCCWRAIAIRPLGPELRVPAPAIRQALATITTVNRAFGSLVTEKYAFKVFFTLSDFYKCAVSLTDVLQEGQRVEIGFVPQTENNGFLYRAIHVAPYTPCPGLSKVTFKTPNSKSGAHTASTGVRKSPPVIDEKSYSQVVKQGMEHSVEQERKSVSPVTIAPPDPDKPLTLNQLQTYFPPWIVNFSPAFSQKMDFEHRRYGLLAWGDNFSASGPPRIGMGGDVALNGRSSDDASLSPLYMSLAPLDLDELMPDDVELYTDTPPMSEERSSGKGGYEPTEISPPPGNGGALAGPLLAAAGGSRDLVETLGQLAISMSEGDREMINANEGLLKAAPSLPLTPARTPVNQDAQGAPATGVRQRQPSDDVAVTCGIEQQKYDLSQLVETQSLKSLDSRDYPADCRSPLPEIQCHTSSKAAQGGGTLEKKPVGSKAPRKEAGRSPGGVASPRGVRSAAVPAPRSPILPGYYPAASGPVRFSPFHGQPKYMVSGPPQFVGGGPAVIIPMGHVIDYGQPPGAQGTRILPATHMTPVFPRPQPFVNLVSPPLPQYPASSTPSPASTCSTSGSNRPDSNEASGGSAHERNQATQTDQIYIVCGNCTATCLFKTDPR